MSSSKSMSNSANPLIDYAGLPPFDAIKPEQVRPAVEQLIADGRARIEQVLQQPSFSWDNLVAALDNEDERLGKAFGPIGHLNGVAQSDALREAYNGCLPLLSEYGTEVGQNEKLFAAYQSLRDGDQWATLTPAQQKDLDNTLRDFRLSGVDLSTEKKQQYMENAKRLSEITSQFSDNVLDATQSWSKHVTDESELDGLPDVAKAGAADKAAEQDLDGWLLTLDFPCYYAVLCHATRSELREEMYRAHTTRASELGPDEGKFDNSALIDEILKLRQAQATLLGFENYAEKSLATKMARSTDEVTTFLRDLGRQAKPQATQELNALREFAASQGATTLNPWDMSFWSERLREQRYSISEEELRPWFPAEKVINGMFAIVEKLFAIRIQAREGVSTWHKDVRFYDVSDARPDSNGEQLASFYLDMYARTGKRGGAWMDDCLGRVRHLDGTLQKPVAYLTCNFAPPAGGKPGLLTHDEVVTLFHEFGHGLHHMLTEQEVSGISGINGVAWDAVELPSQFLENWCWTEEGLALISGHYENNSPLPKEKLDKLLAARNFQSAMMMQRQLEFSLFDMRIHAEHQSGLSVAQILQQVREEVAVVMPPEFNRFQNSFGHIFAGGYAAGYYSYKWAEVLSADAFSRFEEEGVFNAETGKSFRDKILAKGGSREPMELFIDFRGREPSVEPLLRHCGIKANSELGAQA